MSFFNFLFPRKPEPTNPEAVPERFKISDELRLWADEKGTYSVEEWSVFWIVKRSWKENHWLFGEMTQTEQAERFKRSEEGLAREHCAFLNRQVEAELAKHLERMRNNPARFINDIDPLTE